MQTVNSDRQKQALVLLSGGIDSASCAQLLKNKGFIVKGLFVNYGQSSHEQEYISVKELQSHLGIKVDIVSINSEHWFGKGELTGRNALLISTAMLYGGIHNGLIAIGVHAGTPYYDCSAGFVKKMKILVEECSNGLVTLSAPFLDWNKSQIYKYFCDQRIPLNITYSCESGTTPPCGVCLSCLDRRKLEC